MLGRNLLIIDDNHDWRRVADRYFTQEQYKTYSAATCAEGIALAEAHRPDYILLDYHLRDGNAVKVASYIRNSETLKKTLIVIISCDPTRRDAAYTECQADHFIVKCTFGAIHNVLRSLERRVGWERGIVEKGDLRLEAVGASVFLNSKPFLQLSQGRFDLLSLLVEKSPGFISELGIAEHLHGPMIAPEKGESVKILLHRLRENLGPLAERIKNQRNIGWAYIPPCTNKTGIA